MNGNDNINNINIVVDVIPHHVAIKMKLSQARKHYKKCKKWIFNHF